MFDVVMFFTASIGNSASPTIHPVSGEIKLNHIPSTAIPIHIRRTDETKTWINRRDDTVFFKVYDQAKGLNPEEKKSKEQF